MNTAQTPAYDRSKLTAGIVHIGLGNFHRAHLAVYMDDLFAMGLNHDWAIIGGLSSGVGVVVGGVILGVTENLTGYYISTGYKDVPGLVLLLLVLALKPSGLFGKTAIKKV